MEGYHKIVLIVGGLIFVAFIAISLTKPTLSRSKSDNNFQDIEVEEYSEE